MIELTMMRRRKKSSRLRSRRKMIVNKNEKISQLKRKLPGLRSSRRSLSLTKDR